MIREKKLFDFDQQFLKVEDSADLKVKNQELDEPFFNYISPLNQNLSYRKMYWDSLVEKISRSLIILLQVAIIISAYFFGKDILSPFFEILFTKFLKNVYWNSAWGSFFGFGFLALSFLNSLLYILPMLLCKKAGAVFGWATAYIIFAVFYFLIMIAIICALIVLNSIMGNSDKITLLGVYLTINFILVFIWIVAAAILVVKADDIKQQISIE